MDSKIMKAVGTFIWCAVWLIASVIFLINIGG